jgi:predicted Zn-dependent protease with MMP-like domain
MSRSFRLSLGEFCREVRRCLESLPDELKAHLEDVVVDVQEEPHPRDLDNVEDPDDPDGRDEPGELLGLFIGRPITEQEYGERAPNRIVIYRRAIEAVSRTRRGLIRNIRATVIHELAHHFGYSEADLEEFERRQDESSG